MESLSEFIKSNPSAAELKRALAVQMVEQGYSYRQIRDALVVSIGFISTSHQRYKQGGVEGLKSGYWGTQGYLRPQDKQQILTWLNQQALWSLEEVIEHVEVHYGVSYKSLQSYYDLLAQAGFSWKHSHPTHPDKNQAQIAEKKPKLWSYWCSGEPKLPVGKCE
jgi:putative transposase